MAPAVLGLGGWRIDGGLARPATRCLPDCRPATIEDEKPSSSLKVGAAIRSPDASGPNFPLSIGRAPRHERQPIAMLDAPTSYANVAIAQAPGAETPASSSRQWMPTRMASSPWRKCRISCAAQAGPLLSSPASIKSERFLPLWPNAQYPGWASRSLATYDLNRPGAASRGGHRECLRIPVAGRGCN